MTKVLGLTGMALFLFGWSDVAKAYSEVPGAPGYRSTPFGIIHESCIHYVPNGAHIHQDGTVTDLSGNQ